MSKFRVGDRVKVINASSYDTIDHNISNGLNSIVIESFINYVFIQSNPGRTMWDTQLELVEEYEPRRYYKEPVKNKKTYMSLLTKAKLHAAAPRRQITVTKEDIELATAYAEGEISERQVQHAYGYASMGKAKGKLFTVLRKIVADTK